ncbi:hypothetical protein BCR35DRAFT_336129 [Leucosporidium creatinivorum]|uniref:Uncharacterized protein n=1 Tax=Leucosporidium creatinivorum TaxID=106004 RepID=A0A1Y2CMZ8_9BASI|nr:hypothetical protein BCR35DRAFT_336129 [Leucosporidium creatinivorum]
MARSGRASRYNVPLFLEGNSDFIVKPLVPVDGDQEEYLTVEQVLRSRFDSTYKTG